MIESLFGGSGGASLVSDTSDYTFGMEFALSQAAPLAEIRFYSAAGAGGLPVACCIFTVAGQAEVAGTVNTSPSWSGAAGSGWVKCLYDESVILAASTNYRVAVYRGTGSNWYSATAHYWDTGPGAGGVTSGIITAPGAASADGGNQDAFVNPSGGLTYPTQSFGAANYWIDVGVQVAAPGGAGLMLAAFP